MAPYRAQYPVNPALLAKLDAFPNLATIIKTPSAATDPRHIIRLLDNTHYDNVRAFLEFLDRKAIVWPATIKRIVQQTSDFEFHQNLAELHLLHHLTAKSSLNADPVPALGGAKSHDINVHGPGLNAHLEVYTPIDYKGVQLLENTIVHLFKYLSTDTGFHFDLSLDTTSAGDFDYAIEFGSDLETSEWLGDIQEDAARWIKSSTELNARRTWQHPKGRVALSAEVIAICPVDDRLVTFSSATRSTDTRIQFDMGSASALATSPWGRKVRKKLAEMQCGPPRESLIRALVINFSEMDTAYPDFFKWEAMSIYSRITEALQIIIEAIGTPLAYDTAVLANIGVESIFSKPIIFDESLRTAIEHLGREAHFH